MSCVLTCVDLERVRKVRVEDDEDDDNIFDVIGIHMDAIVSLSSLRFLLLVDVDVDVDEDVDCARLRLLLLFVSMILIDCYVVKRRRQKDAWDE